MGLGGEGRFYPYTTLIAASFECNETCYIYIKECWIDYWFPYPWDAETIDLMTLIQKIIVLTILLFMGFLSGI